MKTKIAVKMSRMNKTQNIIFYTNFLLTLTISVFPYLSNETVHVVRSSDILSMMAS